MQRLNTPLVSRSMPSLSSRDADDLATLKQELSSLNGVLRSQFLGEGSAPPTVPRRVPRGPPPVAIPEDRTYDPPPSAFTQNTQRRKKSHAVPMRDGW